MEGHFFIRCRTVCKTYVSPGSASAEWRCFLKLPNRFSPGDGVRLETKAYGKTQEEASEAACRRAVMFLLMPSPETVVWREAHWLLAQQPLLEGLPGTLEEHLALPVHVRARSLEAGVDAARLTPAEVSERVAELIRWCLNTHGDDFDSSHISWRALGQEAGEEPVYSQLNKLMLPGQLRTFIGNHPEFSWCTSGPKSMRITWARDAAPAGKAPLALLDLEHSAPSSSTASAPDATAPDAAELPKTRFS